MRDATHVEMGGKVYEMGHDEFTSKHQVVKYNDYNIEVHKGGYSGNLIHVNAFSLLGIKPLKEKKREPIEFTYTVGGGIAPPNEAYGKTFLCVEILEDEE